MEVRRRSGLCLGSRLFPHCVTFLSDSIEKSGCTCCMLSSCCFSDCGTVTVAFMFVSTTSYCLLYGCLDHIVPSFVFLSRPHRTDSCTFVSTTSYALLYVCLDHIVPSLVRLSRPHHTVSCIFVSTTSYCLLYVCLDHIILSLVCLSRPHYTVSCMFVSSTSYLSLIHI